MKRVLFVISGFFIFWGLIGGITAGAYLLNSAIASGVVKAGATNAWWGHILWFIQASRLVNLVLFMLLVVMVLATLLTVAERKWSALMQDRIGPNRANIFGFRAAGILHTAADAVKMIFKEDFRPSAANASKMLFGLAPILAFAPVFALFAVVPPAPSVIDSENRYISLAVAEPDFGILYVFAIASLAVYGTSLAGWASNNKFALLGGVRAASQMISYEVALGLSLVGIMMAFGGVQLRQLVDYQTLYLWRADLPFFGGTFDLGLPSWGILLQPIGFILFFAASFAETKRAPFDVPEGESEIIGYFVEYSGMKFGLFMISEFVEVVVLAALITSVFLGGYNLPIGGYALRTWSIAVEYPWIHGTILGLVFWTKVAFLCWLQLAIRWTFPRFRYDQIQTLGWKMLLPAGLINVFITGALLLFGQDAAQGRQLFALSPNLRPLALFGLFEIGIVLALTLGRRHVPEKRALAHSDGHGHAPAHATH